MAWLLRAMGLFYALAGIAYARHYALDGAMDRVLEALEGPPPAKEKIKGYWLKLGAGLTVASGLALLTLSWWIAPLMITNAAVQGGWLLYARSAFPPQDADEARGRRQTINAFLIWLVVTAIALAVVWSAHSPVVAGLVQDWLPPLGGAIFLIWMLSQ